MRKIAFILSIVGIATLGICYIWFFVIGQITSGDLFNNPDPNQSYSITGTLIILSIPLLFIVFSIQRLYSNYSEHKHKNWLKL